MGTEVCLISPPKRAYNHHRPPLALMYLASALERGGISSSIIDPISFSDVSGQGAENMGKSGEWRLPGIFGEIILISLNDGTVHRSRLQQAF